MTMTLEKLNELNAAAAKLNEEYQAKAREVNEALLQLSEQACPHKIGDVITINNAYTYTGKQLRITGFVSANNWRVSTVRNVALDKKWFCVGVVLKKDGTDSLIEGFEWGVVE